MTAAWAPFLTLCLWRTLRSCSRWGSGQGCSGHCVVWAPLLTGLPLSPLSSEWAEAWQAKRGAIRETWSGGRKRGLQGQMRSPRGKWIQGELWCWFQASLQLTRGVTSGRCHDLSVGLCVPICRWELSQGHPHAWQVWWGRPVNKDDATSCGGSIFLRQKMLVLY